METESKRTGARTATREVREARVEAREVREKPRTARPANGRATSATRTAPGKSAPQPALTRSPSRPEGATAQRGGVVSLHGVELVAASEQETNPRPTRPQRADANQSAKTRQANRASHDSMRNTAPPSGRRADTQRQFAELNEALDTGWEIVQPVFARPLWSAADDSLTAFSFVLRQGTATRLITVPSDRHVERFIAAQRLAVDERR
jgi:hypothetical protein